MRASEKKGEEEEAGEHDEGCRPAHTTSITSISGQRPSPRVGREVQQQALAHLTDSPNRPASYRLPPTHPPLIV